jgi:hypothetical protein
VARLRARSFVVWWAALAVVVAGAGAVDQHGRGEAVAASSPTPTLADGGRVPHVLRSVLDVDGGRYVMVRLRGRSVRVYDAARGRTFTRRARPGCSAIALSFPDVLESCGSPTPQGFALDVRSGARTSLPGLGGRCGENADNFYVDLGRHWVQGSSEILSAEGCLVRVFVNRVSGEIRTDPHGARDLDSPDLRRLAPTCPRLLNRSRAVVLMTCTNRRRVLEACGNDRCLPQTMSGRWAAWYRRPANRNTGQLIALNLRTGNHLVRSQSHPVTQIALARNHLYAIVRTGKTSRLRLARLPSR